MGSETKKVRRRTIWKVSTCWRAMNCGRTPLALVFHDSMCWFFWPSKSCACLCDGQGEIGITIELPVAGSTSEPVAGSPPVPSRVGQHAAIRMATDAVQPPGSRTHPG